jgi:heat shock protein HtpX
MVLRAYKAQPITYDSAPQLNNIFREICKRSDLDPLPQLYYIPSRVPNAFAVGRGRKAAVALTDGLLRLLSPREIAGVLGHEVAHIINRDISVLGVADTITRTTSTLARIGILMMLFSVGTFLFGSGGWTFVLVGLIMFFAPMLVVILQLTVSRTREFDADQGAAELTGDPAGLASALSKLDPPKPRSIFERILRPGSNRKEPAMLRTHPPTEERLAKLMELVEIQKTKQARQQEIEYLDEAQSNDELLNQNAVTRRPSYHLISGLWY